MGIVTDDFGFVFGVGLYFIHAAHSKSILAQKETTAVNSFFPPLMYLYFQTNETEWRFSDDVSERSVRLPSSTTTGSTLI